MKVKKSKLWVSLLTALMILSMVAPSVTAGAAVLDEQNADLEIPEIGVQETGNDVEGVSGDGAAADVQAPLSVKESTYTKSGSGIINATLTSLSDDADAKQAWVDAVKKVTINGAELVKADTPKDTERGYSISTAKVVINSDVFTESRASYTLTVEAEGYGPVSGNITVRNLGAKTFYLRYLDGDGNVLRSKSYTVDEIKGMSSDEEVIYTALCTMRGITGYKAKGVKLSTLFEDAGIPFADGMHLRTRTNDKNTSNDNNDELAYFNTDCNGGDRGDIGNPLEPFSHEQFMVDRYSFTGLYEDLALKEELCTLIKNKKSGDRSDQEVLDLIDKASKVKVEPMIAYDYVVQILYSNNSPSLPEERLTGKIGEEVGFRFLFGMGYIEDDGVKYLSDESTNHECTRYTFGIDIINPNYAERTITGTDSYSKKVGDAPFDLDAATDAEGRLRYESSDTQVATVSDTGKVTIQGAGTATITITAAETDNYPAATKTVELNVAKGPQKITVPKRSYTKTYGDKAFSLGAKTTGDGKLTYKSSDTKVAEVSAAGRVSIKGEGKAAITISVAATDDHTAATPVKVSLNVRPPKVTLSSVQPSGKKKAVVKWKKDAKATGYEVVYSTSKKFTKSTTKTVTVKPAKTVKTTLKGLRPKKRYYVKVRAYKASGPSKLYGTYSNVETVTVK